MSLVPSSPRSGTSALLLGTWIPLTASRVSLDSVDIVSVKESTVAASASEQPAA